MLETYIDIKAILFDLDGTLVDSAPDIDLSLNLLLQEINAKPVTIEQVRCWVGRGAPNLIKCMMDEQDIPAIQHAALLSRFMQIYQNHVCVSSKPYDGVIPFLNYCKQEHIKMAVVTNKPQQPAIQLLQALGMDSYFSVVLGGDSLPVRKPNPEPLLYATAQLGESVENTMMVGDSRNDIDAAKAINMRNVALSYGYNHGEPIEDCQPDKIIDTMLQLLENDPVG